MSLDFEVMFYYLEYVLARVWVLVSNCTSWEFMGHHVTFWTLGLAVGICPITLWKFLPWCINVMTGQNSERINKRDAPKDLHSRYAGD